MSASSTATTANSGRVIALFGLGYVGSVSACCLARAGHRVIGVEIVPQKVEAINRGKITFVEPGLDVLARDMVAAGRLSATSDMAAAVDAADTSFICVGTPGQPSGAPDYSRLYQVCKSIGRVLANKPGTHDIVIRSTILPGTAEQCALIVSETSGKREGEGFRVLVNPEFLREGTALVDYQSPPFTVIGAESEADAGGLRALYAELPAALFVVPRREAEIIKYSCNLFHAVKVVFGNEIGRLCKAAGIDSHRVMDIFCHDEKLNLSRYYLKPGYAYGGSCLPKDLRAILGYGRQQELDLPMLNSIDESNWQQIEQGFRLIAERQRRKIGMVGLSFKSSTDDLRESPLVLLAQMLVEQGYELRIFDPNVVVAELLGENKTYVEKRLPTADKLVTTDLAEMLTWAECLVIGNRLPAAQTALAQARPDQCVIDLVRAEQNIDTRAEYHGLGWVARPAN
jgi:GDP-mannose 6-dehydrogenase